MHLLRHLPFTCALWVLAGTYSATGGGGNRPKDDVTTQVAMVAGGHDDDEALASETLSPHPKPSANTPPGEQSWDVVCPVHCACMKRRSSVSRLLQRTVDCTTAGISSVPRNVSTSTEVLIVRGNRLRVEQLLALEDLVNLTELDMSSNHIYSLEKLGFYLESIRTLFLDHNELDYLPNRSFMCCESLVYLSVSDNKIEMMDQDAFNGLSRLETLELAKNRLFEINTLWFRELHELKVLNLQDNNIHTLEYSVFKGMKKLTVLDLSFNHLKHVYPEAFHGLEHLKELHMQNNPLANIPSHALRLFSHLDLLDLSGIHLEQLEPGSMQHINVTRLSIAYQPKLKLIDHDTFSHLAHLESLDLSNSPSLMYIDRNSFNYVPSLSTLYLHNNNLSTIEFGVLTSLPKLTQISLHDNPLHCDCTLDWLSKLTNSSSTRPQSLYNLTVLSPSSGPVNGSWGPVCSGPAAIRGTSVGELAGTMPESCPPRVLPLFSADVNTALGESIHFPCRAVGVPAPQTDWLLPTQPGAPGEDEVGGGGPAEHISLTPEGGLYIDYVHGTDSGHYTCLATNLAGRSERTVFLHITNMRANVIVMRITDSAITVTWKSSQYTHDYQILYRRQKTNTSYSTVDIKPYMRSYTVSELAPKTRYEFCIAVQHGGHSLRINCTHIVTRDAEVFSRTGLYSYRDAVIAGAVSAVLIVFVGSCAISHVIKKFNKRRRLQEELYSDNLSQLFLASMDSMSDVTTPITYENRGAAEMFDDDDIDEIRSTASMSSGTSGR